MLANDTECQDCTHGFPYVLNSEHCPMCRSRKIRVMDFKEGEPRSIIEKEKKKR